MKKLRESLSKLDVRKSPEERLIHQVMDLQLIKYKGIQSGDILLNDDVMIAIDKCIEGFIWLYEKGLNLEKNVLSKFTSEEDKAYYQSFMEAFSVFNEFMRTHMHLIEL